MWGPGFVQISNFTAKITKEIIARRSTTVSKSPHTSQNEVTLLIYSQCFEASGTIEEICITYVTKIWKTIKIDHLNCYVNCHKNHYVYLKY